MANRLNNRINFHDLKRSGLRKRKLLKSFIAWLFTNEITQLNELNYIFCDDSYLHEINKTYLQHDDYTDIITFDLSDTTEKVSGEVYISIDRVRDNAEKFGVTVDEELHRVIFHGALHLCGYKDKSPASRKEMRRKEDLYLGKWESGEWAMGNGEWGMGGYTLN